VKLQHELTIANGIVSASSADAHRATGTSISSKPTEDVALKVGDAHDAGGSMVASGSPSKARRRWLGVALCLAVGAGVASLANWTDRPTTPTVTAGTGHGSADERARDQTGSSAEMVEHTDPSLGFSLTYPRTWQRLNSSAESVVLRVTESDAVSIRRFGLESPIDASNLGDVKAVTDGILDSPDAKLTMLQTEQVKVHDLIGVYYLYSFPLHGGQGVHAHYFLFKGSAMYSLVFQAGSASRFEQLAPTFDAVSASFRVVDE